MFALYTEDHANVQLMAQIKDAGVEMTPEVGTWRLQLTDLPDRVSDLLQSR